LATAAAVVATISWEISQRCEERRPPQSRRTASPSSSLQLSDHCSAVPGDRAIRSAIMRYWQATLANPFEASITELSHRTTLP
jgi:hypothetical protein